MTGRQCDAARPAYGMPGQLPRADGQPRCTNAEPGTYGHECGKIAAWIGIDAEGFRACYCDECREHGTEARSCVSFERIVIASW